MRYIALVIILFLSSCCSMDSNSQQQPLKLIDQELSKNYSINKGSIVATYGLNDASKTKSIYAKDYVKLLNEEGYSKSFLSQFKTKYKNIMTITTTARAKSTKISRLILKLNRKYSFLLHNDIAILKENKQGESLQTLAKLDKIISRIPLMLPVQGKIKITSLYGKRKCPHKKKLKYHHGIDLQGAKSTPIYASADGVIENIQRMNGYGNIIDIKHANGFKTRYAHLSKIYVSVGEKVSRGIKIALQGRSGNVTGEHLHFEIWYNNKHLNPYDFISQEL